MHFYLFLIRINWGLTSTTMYYEFQFVYMLCSVFKHGSFLLQSANFTLHKVLIYSSIHLNSVENPYTSLSCYFADINQYFIDLLTFMLKEQQAGHLMTQMPGSRFVCPLGYFKKYSATYSANCFLCKTVMWGQPSWVYREVRRGSTSILITLSQMLSSPESTITS